MNQKFTTMLSVLMLFMFSACTGTSTPLLPIAAEQGNIIIYDAWIRPAFVEGGNGALYMVVENIGTETEVLQDISVDIAMMSEVHQTIQEGDTVRMEPAGELEILPGDQLVLEPGSYHGMLMNIQERLQAGDEVEVQVTLSNAGLIKFQAEVREQ